MSDEQTEPRYDINRSLLPGYSNYQSLYSHIYRKNDRRYAQYVLWVFTQHNVPITIKNIQILTGWEYEPCRIFLHTLSNFGILRKDPGKTVRYWLMPPTKLTEPLVAVIEEFIRHKMNEEG